MVSTQQQSRPVPQAVPGIPATLVEVLAQGAVDAELTVHGWIRSFRSSKNVAFIALTDGSCADTLQIVISNDCPGLTAAQPNLTTGASVRVHGTLAASPGKGQRVELHARDVQVLGTCDATTYPLQKKGHTLEFLRSISHLRSRSNTFGAVFRIRSRLALATHEFFADHGFTMAHTPIITTSDCEGAGEMFEVVTQKRGEPFFGRPASLTVSGQLHGESLAAGLGRIYTFGPTFRAENSNTVRHLSEFWMIEPEAAFFRAPQNRALAEAYLKACLNAVLTHNAADVAFLHTHYDKTLNDTLVHIHDTPFAVMPYTEAVDLLQKSGQKFEYTPEWGKDLQAEHERFLVESYLKKPVVVIDYPKDIKAFYMYQNDDDKTVAAMDVLVPRIGEIIGGSEREYRIERLEKRLLQQHASLDAYQWYFDLNRFGAVPHAGFGLGFERLVMLCTGMTNIRDVIPFPRNPGHAAH